MDKKIKYLYCKKFKIYSVVFLKIIFFFKKSSKSARDSYGNKRTKIMCEYFYKGLFEFGESYIFAIAFKNPYTGSKKRYAHTVRSSRG